MSQPLIAVTGANGQLGRELRGVSHQFPEFKFIFLSRSDLSLEQKESVEKFFAENKPQFCINCAAYTAVDKAESERDLAFLVNGESAGILSTTCAINACKLVHLSTDYVFNGKSSRPYKENDPVDPVNTYGASKLLGEQMVRKNNPQSIIIRTSWVYSEYGNNFVKTMIRLMKERSEINVVNDQTGSPTYAKDLATAILEIVRLQNWLPGIYHYCNEGKITWFEFASHIGALIESNCKVNPIPTTSYPTPAKRPTFSLLDTSLFRKTFPLAIPEWKASLAQCISAIKKHEA